MGFASNTCCRVYCPLMTKLLAAKPKEKYRLFIGLERERRETFLSFLFGASKRHQTKAVANGDQDWRKTIGAISRGVTRISYWSDTETPIRGKPPWENFPFSGKTLSILYYRRHNYLGSPLLPNRFTRLFSSHPPFSLSFVKFPFLPFWAQQISL